MEQKDSLKLEFDFLKSVFIVLLVALFSNIAYLFTKDLSFLMVFLNLISISILFFWCLNVYFKIDDILKKEL